MNNVNYPYLAGFLQSELTNLAYDEKFLKMKSFEKRAEYIKQIINTANEKAKQFEAETTQLINNKKKDVPDKFYWG